MSASSASTSEPAWRLIVDPPGAGAWNMAVDEALLDSVAAGLAPATLRFYRWSPPCLSLGYFQSLSVVDVQACQALGVDIVRRPTGGRAILHEDELTYSVALPLTILGEDRGVLPSYARLSEALLGGLRLLGVPATLAPASFADVSPSHGPACFDRPSAHEIMLDGRKLVGSAQVRRGNAVLQHGSILVDPQLEKLDACLRLEVGHPRLEALDRSVAGLAEIGDYEVGDITAAIATAFQQTFGANFERGSIDGDELRAAVELEAKYQSAAWTGRSFVEYGLETTRTR